MPDQPSKAPKALTGKATSSVTWSPDGGFAAATEGTPLEMADAGRYEDLGLLGIGGMGEVRRVRDMRLDRVIAMKVLPLELAGLPTAIVRFVEEARTTAQLEHPGIVPVHDIGRLEDGRPFFTMKQIQGRTLREILKRSAEATRRTELRKLVDLFQRVCEAVAYAHARGVIHRDLKPANVMVGAFGEVLVVDWGIAQAGAEFSVAVAPSLSEDAPTGEAMAGTPEYMAPEQARGDRGSLGPWTDVWALGAMLSEILSGSVDPFACDEADLPGELVGIARSACASNPAERPHNAGILAEQVSAWLQGAQRREQAMVLVESARIRWISARDLRDRARELRGTATTALDGLPSWADLAEKRPWWARIEEAETLERDAALEEVACTEQVHAALALVPELDEAHDLLADYLQSRHAHAEAHHQRATAARYEALLAVHARQRHRRWLAGIAALTLVTDPPGASVELFRFESRDRLLTPVRVADLGRTPLVAVEVPHGSYLLVILGEGGVSVNYPVTVGREDHWDGVPPGEAAALPLRLPRPGELGPDEILVPAGPCRLGGDALAFGPLPSRRVWVDSFVIGRFPVTEPEYHAFLTALLREGRGEEARRYAPCNEPALGGLLWPVSADGGFSIEGRDPRLPVHGVDWFCADAYARELATRTGLPWRLPGDAEWEKAARGVDGRFAPFGDHIDGQFCCFAGSHRGNPSVRPVDEFPLDVSPYGVRGLGGNVRDWIQGRYERNGHPVVNGRIPVDFDATPTATRLQRGGAWSFHEQHARSATRWWQDPLFRHTAAGFRVARAWGG